MMSDVIKIAEETFSDEVLASTIPVLVDFYADWCGPCRALDPALRDLAREYAGEARIVKVDVEAAPRLKEAYTVASLPTLILFRQGEIVERIVGTVPRSTLARAVERSLDA
jgi:thioredoxin 1